MENKMKEELKIGDTVVLKGNITPQMLIKSINEEDVKCTWHTKGGIPKEKTYNASLLEKAKSPLDPLKYAVKK